MRIIIEGDCAEGKTTLAELITTTLRDHGINVVNSDIDAVLGGVISLTHPNFQAKRIEAIATKQTLIKIETVQIRKGKR